MLVQAAMWGRAVLPSSSIACTMNELLDCLQMQLCHVRQAQTCRASNKKACNGGCSRGQNNARKPLVLEDEAVSLELATHDCDC